MMHSDRVLRSILFALLAVALLSPIIPGIPFVFTANFLKATVFNVAVEIAFVLWVYLALRRPEFRPNFGHPAIFFFLLFTLALVVTFPLSINPFLSFWSSAQRVMGVFHYLHLAAFLIMMASTVREWKEWRVLFILSTAAACIGDVVAIYQWWTDDTGLLRVPGLFANTLFLAQYAVLHMGIAAILWAKAETRWERFLYIDVFILHIFALILTASRASFLALGAVVVCAAIILALNSSKRVVRLGVPIATALSVILAVTGVLFIQTRGYEWAYAHLPFSVARMAYPNASLNDGQSIFDIQIADRDNTYRVALDGIAERPIAGWGIESFRVVFDRAFDPLGRDSDMIESGFDRIHNQYLEVLFANGIIGFVPYMLFWAALFYFAYRRYRAEEEYWMKSVLLFLFLLFVAHFIQLAFLFDARGAVEVFLALVAFLVFVTPNARVFQPPRVPIISRAAYVAVPLGIAMLPLIYFGNVLPMKQMYVNAIGMKLLATDIPAATAAFEKSFKPETRVLYWLRLTPLNSVRVTIDLLGVRTSSFAKLVAMNVREADKSAEEFPELFSAAHSAAIAHRQAAKFFPENAAYHLAQQELMAQRMLEQGPGHIETYEELGDIAMVKGDFERAVYHFEQSQQRVLWDFPLMGRLDFRMAEAYARAGEYQASMDALDAAYVNNYGIFFDYRLLDALVANFPEDASVLPDGMNFYVSQFYEVQKERFHMVLLTARYFELLDDAALLKMAVDRLFELDPERAVDFFPKEAS